MTLWIGTWTRLFLWNTCFKSLGYPPKVKDFTGSTFTWASLLDLLLPTCGHCCNCYGSSLGPLNSTLHPITTTRGLNHSRDSCVQWGNQLNIMLTTQGTFGYLGFLPEIRQCTPWKLGWKLNSALLYLVITALGIFSRFTYAQDHELRDDT